MASFEEIYSRISGILESQLFGVLATQGSKYPYTSLVGVANDKKCRELIFATARDTRKFQNLSQENKVSILFDTRHNEALDFLNAEAMTALGTAKEVSDVERTHYLDLLLAKHPNMQDFLNTPRSSIIKVKVDKYILVNHFQNVIEIDVS